MKMNDMYVGLTFQYAMLCVDCDVIYNRSQLCGSYSNVYIMLTIQMDVGTFVTKCIFRAIVTSLQNVYIE